MRNAVDTRDYRHLVSTAKGLRAATRMLMKTGLLKQFELAKNLLYGEVQSGNTFRVYSATKGSRCASAG